MSARGHGAQLPTDDPRRHEPHEKHDAEGRGHLSLPEAPLGRPVDQRKEREHERKQREEREPPGPEQPDEGNGHVDRYPG